MNTKSRYFFYLILAAIGFISACGGGGGSGTGSTGSPGVMQITGTSYDVSEGTVVNILVERSGGADGAASVQFATSDGTASSGSDYTAANGTLTWPHNVSGNRTVSIAIADDNVAEPVESFVLTLSDASGARLGVNASATISIIDNDDAQIAAFGAITELRSVTVNGIRYGTDAAVVYVNGMPAGASDLKLGETVLLDGEVNFSEARGEAHEISHVSTVIGPVENINAPFDRLIALGQTVLTNEDTVFDPSIDGDTFAGLDPGTTVQISGHFNADGDIVATRIEPNAGATRVQLVGTVTGLDLTNMLFKVNRLTVDYSNAVLIDLPEGMPTEGLLVSIRGTLVNGVLNVDEISSAGSIADTAGQRVHLGGMISQFESASAFSINGIRVTTDAGTAVVNGTADDLQPDAEITVDGFVSSAGDAVMANRITIGDPVPGRSTTQFDFDAFTNISVLGISRVMVIHDSEYSVEVSASSDAMADVQVSQDGDTVTFGGDNGQLLSAFVRMPVLNRVDVSEDSIAHVTLRDFDQLQMEINVDGVSSVRGENLVIGGLAATVNGVSLLDLGGIRPIGSATVHISGVSQATLNMEVGSTLTGSVRTGQGTGESTLFYYGTNAIVNVTTDIQSNVIRLGDTRP